MSIDDGYAVQDALLARWREDGRVLVGLKAGLTSQAKMEQKGVTEPSFGMLMGDTLDPDGGIVPTDKLIHPRVEAEIAFVTKTELSGIDVPLEDIIAATDFVHPALSLFHPLFPSFLFS